MLVLILRPKLTLMNKLIATTAENHTNEINAIKITIATILIIEKIPISMLQAKLPS